ncbi:MAG: alpha/beta hydrolase [Candidatus Woesearchaeota archaeon]
MERVIFKNSRAQSLIGYLYPSESKSIIIFSHGFTGDKSERGKFESTAQVLRESGYAVLRFDYSGCGESDDDTLTVAKQVNDLQSAIAFVRLKGYERIGLLGYSLGGLIALKCFDGIETIVLWAPVTNKISYTWDKRYSKEQLTEFLVKGYATKIKKNSIRSTVLIDKQMLIDRESVNQRMLLKYVTCPVLIIHGDCDTNVPYTDSQNAISLLSNHSELKILNDADHWFSHSFDNVKTLSVAWFLKNLMR